MKLKYYLRGLGTGVLFATLVLFISYTYHNTDAQIKKRAKELGMVEASETTPHFVDNTTAGDGDDTKSDEKKTGDDDNTATKENSSSKDETTTIENNTTNENNTQDTTTSSENQTTAGNNSQTEYEFTIVSGMGSSQVAQLLYSAGIIDNMEEFDRYLVSNGYAERIRTGTFKVRAGNSYMDIALLITN